MLTDYFKILKDARAKRGMSQQDLAVAVGVTVATVYRWEKGRAVPSRLARQKLDEILAEKEVIK